MPVSPLEALVQGFQENRAHQEQQAKTIADQEARKFEQTYRLDQAKQQAAQQAIQVRQADERNATSKLLAGVAQKKQEETERKNKVAEDMKKTHETVQAQLYRDRDTLKDAQSIEKRVDKIADTYMTAHPTITKDEALNAALEDVRISRQRLIPGGSVTPPQGVAAPPPAVGPATGNSILSGTGNPLAALLGLGQQGGQPQQGVPGGPPLTGIVPQPESPAVRSEASPVAIQKQKNLVATELQKKADTKWKEAMAATEDSYRKSQINSNNANAARAAAQASIVKEESIAHILVERQHAEQMRQDIVQAKERNKLAREKFDYEKTQDAIKNTATRDDAIKDTWKQYKSVTDQKKDLAKRMLEADTKIAAARTFQGLDLSKVKNRDTGEKFTPVEIHSLRLQKATELDTLTRARNEIADEQRTVDTAYLDAQRLLMENGAMTIATPGGAPSPAATKKAIDAAKKAVGAGASAGQKLAPARVIPPGAPVPSGQPGLYTRPAQRSAPARQAPKPDTSKKPVRQRSTEDLWKALKGK